MPGAQAGPWYALLEHTAPISIPTLGLRCRGHGCAHRLGRCATAGRWGGHRRRVPQLLLPRGRLEHGVQGAAGERTPLTLCQGETPMPMEEGGCPNLPVPRGVQGWEGVTARSLLRRRGVLTALCPCSVPVQVRPALRTTRLWDLGQGCALSGGQGVSALFRVQRGAGATLPYLEGSGIPGVACQLLQVGLVQLLQRPRHRQPVVCQREGRVEGINRPTHHATPGSDGSIVTMSRHRGRLCIAAGPIAITQ